MTLLDSVHRVLDPAARSSPARLLRAIHLFVVVTGVAAVILGSVPEVMADHGAAIAVVIDAALVFFLADYAARLAVAPRHRRADRNRPWAARLAWAVSAWGLVDVCAVLPLPLARLAGFDPATADLFGILWVLKLSRYSPGLGMLGRVLRNEREPLLSVSLFFVKVLLTAATLGYLFERTRQPDSFGTIPDTLWWTIATLTTTGYGDEVPATVAGRILGGLVMVCGIGVFALWAGSWPPASLRSSAAASS